MSTAPFLQSKEWEWFQKSLGRKVWRVAGNLVIRHDLPAGFNYLYSPRPLEVSEWFLAETEKIAKKERAIFLKIDPVRGLDLNIKILKFLKIRPESPLQPRKTVILDLTRPEDDLLRAMHEKTRYNIRLAERKGVAMVNRLRTSLKEDFEIFWKMLEETSERDRFHTHAREYYEKLLAIRSADFSSELFFAKYRGRAVAAALVNFYAPSGIVTYLHGASSREYKDVMAPHLLHWRIIEEAKSRGFKHYDLWGIDEKKWPGVTRFKLGFGGEEVEYPQSIDIIYRPFWRRIYKLAR